MNPLKIAYDLNNTIEIHKHVRFIHFPAIDNITI